MIKIWNYLEGTMVCGIAMAKFVLKAVQEFLREGYCVATEYCPNEPLEETVKFFTADNFVIPANISLPFVSRKTRGVKFVLQTATFHE